MVDMNRRRNSDLDERSPLESLLHVLYYPFRLFKKIDLRIRFFFILLIIASIIIHSLESNSFIGYDSVIEESTGILVDIIFFGLMLTFFEILREKKDKALRLTEELDDYRGWKSKEASYRNQGIIKRLQRLGTYSIDLHKSFLRNSELDDMKFIDKSGLRTVLNFSKNSLIGTSFSNYAFEDGEILSSYFENCNFKKCNFKNNQIQNLEFNSGLFLNSNFINQDFRNLKVKSLTLKGCRIIRGFWNIEIEESLIFEDCEFIAGITVHSSQLDKIIIRNCHGDLKKTAP